MSRKATFITNVWKPYEAYLDIPSEEIESFLQTYRSGHISFKLERKPTNNVTNRTLQRFVTPPNPKRLLSKDDLEYNTLVILNRKRWKAMLIKVGVAV